MESSFIFMNKLPNSVDDTSNNYFYIQTKWLDTTIEFTLQETTTNHTYKGNLNIEELQESAAELEIPYQDFYDDCRKALTTQLGNEEFKYEFDISQKRLHLSKKEPFTILYLDVELIKAEEVETNRMLDAAIELMHQQRECTTIKQDVSAQQHLNYSETVDALQRCLEEKRTLENTLLKKFARLLNSKKQKIVELREMLAAKDVVLVDEQMEEEEEHVIDLIEEPNTSAVSKRKKTTRKTKMLVISSDEEPAVDDNEDDFAAPTQAMTQQPIENVEIMPKRSMRNCRKS